MDETWVSVEITHVHVSQSELLGFACNICSYTATNPVLTSCGHLFCQQCLYRVLDYPSLTPGQAKPCPACATPVCQDKNIIPIVPAPGTGPTRSRAGPTRDRAGPTGGRAANGVSASGTGVRADSPSSTAAGMEGALDRLDDFEDSVEDFGCVEQEILSMDGMEGMNYLQSAGLVEDWM